ncbi:MAG: folylpolyglutamate synthase/dihydrofolate synthase family protein [candidate division KSB1 bacterium]
MTPETLRYLDALGFLGWQLGLERIEKLCEFWGNPHLRYPVVHIAGTNGKGSTAAMLAAMAQAAGLRVGLYTSPHLVHPRERMRVNGVPISSEELEHAIQSCRQMVDALRATYFEVLTAIALHWFAEERVELAIIETGLGGRLDATNVVVPEVTIITSIALEHQEYLGRTLALIAKEKAGIIKTGRPCVSGVKTKSARAVIQAECQTRHVRFIDVPVETRRHAVQLSAAGTTFRVRAEKLGIDPRQNFYLNLLGEHQIDNALLALWAAHTLQERGLALNETARHAGLAQVKWPARLQLLAGSPRILIDAAHNADGVRKLVQSLRALFPQRRVQVVMSLLKDKALTQVLRAWREVPVEFFFAPAKSDRALAPKRMQAEAQSLGFTAHACGSAHEAFTAARAQCAPDDVLCIAGSHYLIGELMEEGLLPYPY